MTENIDFQQAYLCLFSRDSVLLKCGTWLKKIEVAKAAKGEEISVNLISSEYGKPWKYLCISHRNVPTICTDILYITYIEGMIATIS